MNEDSFWYWPAMFVTVYLYLFIWGAVIQVMWHTWFVEECC